MRLSIETLLVIVHGVTSHDDALMSIGLGADGVVFDFGVSPRQISAIDAHDIIRRMPAGSLAFGSFKNEMPSKIVGVANTIGLAGVRIEGAISVEDLTYVSDRVATVMRTSSSEAIPQGKYDYLVVPHDDDSFAVGAAMSLFETTRPLVIGSGGLDEHSVTDIIQRYPIAGVEARGSVESVTGVKDPVLLQQFIRAARWADENRLVERPTEGWSL